MIVVSDNGPVAFLVQIGRIELLPRLYGSVLIPPAVLTELRHPATPMEVRAWIAYPPAWLAIQAPVGPVEVRQSGQGEREAIQLAKERGAFLLCDDRAAVAQARREGLGVTGTLGILQVAHARGWLDVEAVPADLKIRTEFRFPNEERMTEIVRDADTLRSEALSDDETPNDLIA